MSDRGGADDLGPVQLHGTILCAAIEEQNPIRTVPRCGAGEAAAGVVLLIRAEHDGTGRARRDRRDGSASGERGNEQQASPATEDTRGRCGRSRTAS